MCVCVCVGPCARATPWIAACQDSLSITSSQSLLKLMSIELVMPSNHLILSLENPRDGGAWWAAVYGVAQDERMDGVSEMNCGDVMDRKVTHQPLCCW